MKAFKSFAPFLGSRRIFRALWCRHNHRSGQTEFVCEADKYNGLTVNLGQLRDDLPLSDLRNLLSGSLSKWRLDGKACVWLRVPMSHSHMIREAGCHGFTYHHAEGQTAMLKLWLRDDLPDSTPQFATHQVGVSGLVLSEDENKVLVVQDRHRLHTLWKFPGGLANLGEDFGETAVREVYEETGIKSEFKSILAFRQQHQQPGAFGRSDIYVICRLLPLTFDLIPCRREIQKCEFMDVDRLKEEVTAPLTQRMLELVKVGQTRGFRKVDIYGEEMLSVYKGLKYKMYHRHLGGQECKSPGGDHSR